MEYIRLGSAGLKVSRICLGTNDIRLEEMARVGARRRGGPPVHAGAPSSWALILFDTADVYSLGVSEEILGRALKDFAPAARSGGNRHQSVQRDRATGAKPAAACPASTSCTPSTTACGGWGRITWTSTRSTASITRPPSRRRSRRSDDVVKMGKALYIGASSCTPGSSPKCSTRPMKWG